METKLCKCGFDITEPKYSQHKCSPNPNIGIKNKLMVVPETVEQAFHYFGDNDKLEAFGVLRCKREGKIGNHVFGIDLELPKFQQVFSGLTSNDINDFIYNFLTSHSKTHEGKLIKITIEATEVDKEEFEAIYGEENCHICNQPVGNCEHTVR